MKVFQIVLISLSFVFLVIGIDQTIRTSFSDSYFIFMLMLTCFFGYTYLKGKENMKNEEPPSRSKKTSPKR